MRNSPRVLVLPYHSFVTHRIYPKFMSALGACVLSFCMQSGFTTVLVNSSKPEVCGSSIQNSVPCSQQILSCALQRITCQYRLEELFLVSVTQETHECALCVQNSALQMFKQVLHIINTVLERRIIYQGNTAITPLIYPGTRI